MGKRGFHGHEPGENAAGKMGCVVDLRFQVHFAGWVSRLAGYRAVRIARIRQALLVSADFRPRASPSEIVEANKLRIYPVEKIMHWTAAGAETQLPESLRWCEKGREQSRTRSSQTTR